MADVSYIDRIISLVKSYFDQIATYEDEYVYTDFDDDDIPNVRAVNQLIDISIGTAVLPPVDLDPYNAGTALPISINNFQVDYSDYGTYPDIMVFYTDTGVEIKTATITRTPLESPTTVTVDAANDGSGVTDGKLTIVIKQ